MSKSIAGRVGSGSGGYRDVDVDQEVGGLASRQYIWNTSSLAWEKATGSSGAGNVTVTNFPATQNVAVVTELPAGTQLIGQVQEKAPSGSSADGTVALASANTWYPVPASPPVSDYILLIVKENEDGTIRFSFDNGGVPSVTNGVKAPKFLVARMAANASMYYGSDNAGDDINYSIIGIS